MADVGVRRARASVAADKDAGLDPWELLTTAHEEIEALKLQLTAKTR